MQFLKGGTLLSLYLVEFTVRILQLISLSWTIWRKIFINSFMKFETIRMLLLLSVLFE